MDSSFVLFGFVLLSDFVYILAGVVFYSGFSAILLRTPAESISRLGSCLFTFRTVGFSRKTLVQH